MAEKAEEMQLSVRDSTSVPAASFESGGYDYDFVENPSEDMNCSICLSVLRDPHLTNCCGNHFCRSCITRIKDDGKPCPLCQEKHFTTMLNKSISRKVKELTIHCPNKSEGCEWTGAIRDVESHLDREDGCGYMAVKCVQCNESYTRITLTDHQKWDCPYRPYACDYCGHKDTMKAITEDHWPVCEEYPIRCPNECECTESLKRKDLDIHVKANCPLQVVSCEFLFAGCDAQIVRQDLSAHMMKQQSIHLALLAASFQQQAIESSKLKGAIRGQAVLFQKREAETKKRIADLEKVVGEQQSVLTQKDMLLSENKKRMVKLETTVKQHEEQIHELKTAIKRQKNIPEAKTFPPVDLYMKDLQLHWAVDDQWFSEPFYSHPGGYKMCLSVYAAGVGQGNGSHVSVFAHIMKGEYDDQLSWPYRGTVTVTLIMEDDDDEDQEEELKFTSKCPAKAAERVDDGKILNDFGQGLSRFVEWDDISYMSFLHFRVESVYCRTM